MGRSLGWRYGVLVFASIDCNACGGSIKLPAGAAARDEAADVALTNNIPGTWTVSLPLNTCQSP